MDYSLLGQTIARLKHSYSKNGFPNLPNIINNNRMNCIKILKMLPRIKKYTGLLYDSLVSDIKTDIIPKRYIFLLDVDSTKKYITELNVVLKTIVNRNIGIIFKFYTILCKKDKTFAGFSSESEMLEFFISVLNENKEYIYDEYVKIITLKEYSNDISIFKQIIS